MFDLLLLPADFGRSRLFSGRERNTRILHCADSLTKNCTVVDRMPHADTPNITVASDAIYKTRSEAEKAMQALTPCIQ